MRTPAFATAALAVVALSAGCERLGIPVAPSPEAEARAVGAGCRHAGRSLADCYAAHADASKAAIFAGWRDMNDYMTDKKIDTVKPAEPAAGEGEEGAAAGKPGRADARRDSRGDGKAEARTDGKPEGRSDGRPEGRSDGRPEGRSDAKPEGKVGSKPDSRSEPVERRSDKRAAEAVSPPAARSGADVPAVKLARADAHAARRGHR